ncbi:MULTISPECIES: hypothetical protein [unclassified Streptomyces]|uniref:hypothetical protein n=1 Tax=unclassified Streptomyces TaxID=2593676 RepID=UPI00163C7B42|nr:MULTISPECIES: hypothetical protein [unclassified Streptomyces]
MRERGEPSERADPDALATALPATVVRGLRGGMPLSRVRRSSTACRRAVSAVTEHIESHLVR